MAEEKLDAEEMLGYLLEKVSMLTKENTMLEIRLKSALSRIPEEVTEEDDSDAVHTDNVHE
jgi:hypothetical protein